MPPLQQSEFPLFSFTISSVYAEFGRDAACRWCEMFRLGQLQEIQRNLGDSQLPVLPLDKASQTGVLPTLLLGECLSFPLHSCAKLHHPRQSLVPGDS